MAPLRLLYVACTEANTVSIFVRAEDGSLTLREELEVPGGPMWLCTDPQQRRLYCPLIEANEVASFAIAPDDGALTPLGRAPYPSLGDSDASGRPWEGPPCPCHVTTDRTGRFLFSAFYTGAILTVHAIGDDGAAAGEPLQTIHTSHGCHSIQADPSNRFVYVPCVAATATSAGGDPNNFILGGNRIFTFRFDPATGELTPAGEPTIPEPTGAVQEPRFGGENLADAPTNRFGHRPERGPRHVVFHPSLPLLFTSDEQSNSVSRYAIDLQGGGALTPAGSAETTSPDTTAATNVSEIRIDATGSAIFCPNRGDDTVATFSLDDEGALSQAGRFATAHIPQAIELTPDGAFMYSAGGQPTGTSFPDEDAAHDGLTIFSVDGAQLEEVGTGTLGLGAVRLLALDLVQSSL